MRVDLHIHSTASDGAYSPAEVVQIALTNKLDVIALTDHDTIDGIHGAQQAASSTALEVIPGIELTVECDQFKFDLLGYYLNPENPMLRQALAEIHRARVSRAEQMVDKLGSLGMPIPLQRVYDLAAHGSVTRAHVARVMFEQRLIGSIQEAFDRYIGDSGPAYVPHYQLTPERAIEIVHEAGGVAILAHPVRYADPKVLITTLVPMGLDGIEVYYPDHTRTLIRDMRAVARQHNLLMTSGSDFHRRSPDGSARIGSVRPPADLKIVESLRDRAQRYRQ
jgi:predicted metal-dependent phosphoesterase TrpH